MPRPDVNRSGEMETFVQVVERGGFSAAARALGMTPSAVSKLIGRLEARLGARLVQRSTRRLELTAEGEQFHALSRGVLADLDEAERSVSAALEATPRGRVVVNASVSFGTQVLLPLVPRLVERHPQLSLDIALTDRVVDLIEARADIAIRWGPLPPSELIARRLGETRQVIVAAPAYLARRGTPRRPAELETHERLDFSYRRRVPDWPFRVDGRLVEVPLRARVRASDGEALRHLALAGLGFAQLSRYQVQADLDAGRLVTVLEDCDAGEVAPIHAVYLGRAERLPARVRAVLDFLVDEMARDRRFAPTSRLAPHEVRIEEGGEPLVDLAEAGLVVDAAYHRLGYTTEPRLRARRGIAERLRRVDAALPHGWRLRIWDAWRPRAVQRALYQAFRRQLAARHPDWDEAALETELHRFVAPPDRGPGHVPPHLTGGAVDLTLQDAEGRELDLGSAFDELSARAPTAAPGLLPAARANRDVLVRAMAEAGFVNWPDEWWHWGCGDPLSAALRGDAVARYGAIETVG